MRDSGHCAWLYHKYRVFEGGDPKGGIHVTAFPSDPGTTTRPTSGCETWDRSPVDSVLGPAATLDTIIGGAT